MVPGCGQTAGTDRQTIKKTGIPYELFQRNVLIAKASAQKIGKKDRD
jgi:hypothetical protein